MYNKYITLITAENKEKSIANTIWSCLKGFNTNKIKIIVIYTNLNNEKFLLNKFEKYKNVIFFKVFVKKKYPTQDQLFKIQKALKFIKNEWVLLLDGDDLFKHNKINEIDKLRLDKNKIYLHNHEIQIQKYKSNTNKKFYKKNFIYKNLMNNWPENINTSSIVVNGNLLKEFYCNHNPYQWKFLAIDVQIILYFFFKKKFKNIKNILTTKVENINNLDRTFSNKLKKIYWQRRMEQHKLTHQLSGKLNLIDRCITLIILKFFR